MERWATFDCYGTLVDWNGGIRAELEKLFGVELADGLLVRYHELEPEIKAESPGISYSEVLTLARNPQWACLTLYLSLSAGAAGMPLPQDPRRTPTR